MIDYFRVYTTTLQFERALFLHLILHQFFFRSGKDQSISASEKGQFIIMLFLKPEAAQDIGLNMIRKQKKNWSKNIKKVDRI